MEKIIITSPLADAAGILQDLLRAHFPGIKIESKQELDTDENINEESCSSLKFPENTAFLTVEGVSGATGFKASFVLGEKVYTHTEMLPFDLFPEERISRERRLLRLAVYRTVSRYWKDIHLRGKQETGWRPSPWGVLTGVRPTKIVHRLFEQGFDKERVIHHLTRDYAISPQKAGLVVETAQNQLPYLPDRDKARKLAGIYVGIPFCPTRCHYCSFPSFSLQRWGHLLENYLDGLSQEIKTVGRALREAGIKVDSVYLGGGTPTILSSCQMDGLFNVIEESLDFERTREITVEGGRPDTLDREKLTVLKDHGVTRLSINPQTMHDPTLEAIGRRHTVSEIIHAFRLAREKEIPVLNMDLIIGLPGEDSKILRKTLQEVTGLAPENITLHALAIKRAAVYSQKKVVLPGQVQGERMMELAQDVLTEAGYIPYYLYRQKQILAHGENVGYTLNGHPCLYNIVMMEERQSILGCGVGAGSKIVRTADWSVDNFYNPKDLLVYLQRLQEIIERKVDKLKAFV